MRKRLNERAGGDGGVAVSFHAQRPRPVAPQRERRSLERMPAGHVGSRFGRRGPPEIEDILAMDFTGNADVFYPCHP